MDQTSSSHKPVKDRSQHSAEENSTPFSSSEKTVKPSDSFFSNFNNSSGKDDTEDLLGVFVNEDGQAYYLKKWAKARPTWNWAAFFLSLWWLAYRKMYIPFIAILGAFLFLRIITALFHLDFSKVDGLLRLAVMILLGIYGNSIYHQHALKTIAKYKNSGEGKEVVKERIAAKGGVGFESFLLCNVMIILYVIIAGML